MKVAKIELVGTAEQAAELVQQLEQQCIQTVECTVAPHPTIEGATVVTVEPHFGYRLEAQLLELLI